MAEVLIVGEGAHFQHATGLARNLVPTNPPIRWVVDFSQLRASTVHPMLREWHTAGFP